MLTIKQVLPWNDHETIVEVKEVRLTKEENTLAQTSDERWVPVVDGLGLDGIHYLFNEGVVYVMNSSGKTVANYGLSLNSKSGNSEAGPR